MEIASGFIVLPKDARGRESVCGKSITVILVPDCFSDGCTEFVDISKGKTGIGIDRLFVEVFTRL
jgi:hypothetical protein